MIQDKHHDQGKCKAIPGDGIFQMVDGQLIRHWNQHQHEVEETRDWLSEGPLTIGVTAGASCPNNLIEDVICRLLELRGTSTEEFLASN